MDARHFREYVVRPTLKKLDPTIPYTQAAEDLLVGTAAQESNFKYLKQLGGPALGVYQIEPATFRDLWANYLTHRPLLAELITGFCVDPEDEGELVWNLQWATVICRLIYYRAKGAIPNDLAGQATYWKAHYNSHLGKGTTQQYLASYYRYVDNTVRIP